jgi:hypothetical protein
VQYFRTLESIEAGCTFLETLGVDKDERTVMTRKFLTTALGRLDMEIQLWTAEGALDLSQHQSMKYHTNPAPLH